MQRRAKLAVIDQGQYEHHRLYRGLIGDDQPEILQVINIGASENVRRFAETFKASIHNTNVGDRFEIADAVDGIIVIMRPEGRMPSLMQLMREHNGTPILVCKPPACSLEEAIELQAFAELQKTDLYVGALRRYAAGVCYLLEVADEIRPLTHFLGSINSGIYASEQEYLRESVWHYADLISFLVAECQGQSDIIPNVLTAFKNSIFNRTSVSVNFAYPNDLIGTMSSTSQHAWKTDYDELLRYSGSETWVSISDALKMWRHYDRTGLRTHSPYSDEQSGILSGVKPLLDDFVTAVLSGDASTSRVSFRSCLPGMWVLDAINRATSGGTSTVLKNYIGAEHGDKIVERYNSQLAKGVGTDEATLYRERGFVHARTGDFEQSIADLKRAFILEQES